jgi:hypothetical protein
LEDTTSTALVLVLPRADAQHFARRALSDRRTKGIPKALELRRAPTAAKTLRRSFSMAASRRAGMFSNKRDRASIWRQVTLQRLRLRRGEESQTAMRWLVLGEKRGASDKRMGNRGGNKGRPTPPCAEHRRIQQASTADDGHQRWWRTFRQTQDRARQGSWRRADTNGARGAHGKHGTGQGSRPLVLVLPSGIYAPF